MKDPRLALVKEKIHNGEITMFSQIFDIIPVEEFAAQLWLQENPHFEEVPDTVQAQQEIEALIKKLLNPIPSPAVYHAMQSREEKGN